MAFCFLTFFFGLEGSLGQPLRPNFPSPRATVLTLRLDCSTAALTTPQKVLPELKMLDFSDRTRTGISILTLAADLFLDSFTSYFQIIHRLFTF